MFSGGVEQIYAPLEELVFVEATVSGWFDLDGEGDVDQGEEMNAGETRWVPKSWADHFTPFS